MADAHIETERKFLIKRPDAAVLAAAGGTVKKIKQTYLTDNAETGAERRVRKITSGGKVSYVKTEKTTINALSRTEDERELTREEYLDLYSEAVSELTKTRYAFPYCGHTIEIDVYPKRIGGRKLEGLAIMEIEMESEDDRICIPGWIEIERELTGTRDFSNKRLAKSLFLKAK